MYASLLGGGWRRHGSLPSRPSRGVAAAVTGGRVAVGAVQMGRCFQPLVAARMLSFSSRTYPYARARTRTRTLLSHNVSCKLAGKISAQLHHSGRVCIVANQRCSCVGTCVHARVWTCGHVRTCARVYVHVSFCLRLACACAYVCTCACMYGGRRRCKCGEVLLGD
jgi:hypothetical protein